MPCVLVGLCIIAAVAVDTYNVGVVMYGFFPVVVVIEQHLVLYLELRVLVAGNTMIRCVNVRCR